MKSKYCIFTLLILLCGCSGFFPDPPTIERTNEMYKSIEVKLQLEHKGSAPPVIMTENTNRLVVDGNGIPVVELERNYTTGELAHELCHAVQWNHGLPFEESTCRVMDVAFTWRRPVWPQYR